MAGIEKLSPAQSATQLSRVAALQEIEHVMEGLTPLQKEALELREQGYTDEEAGKASMRPCTPTTFRQRVHDAQVRARELAATVQQTHTPECKDDKEMP